MNKDYTGLITIQKFIYLLNDFYYNEFTTYLLSVNATLPLKLTKAIRHKLPAFDSHEELCKKIYGSFEKGPKQNFNQLAAYTFRLSGVLAQNYPHYLHHNIFKIQSLVNEGKGVEGEFTARILLDVAERTDDFQCQIFVLNFLSQQAFITKDTAVGMKLDARLADVLNSEKTFVDIQLLARKTMAQVSLNKRELEVIKEYLLGFANNSSAAIRILARNSFLTILYQFDLQAFNHLRVEKIIDELDRDFRNHGYVVFPYLVDMRSSLFYMKLNSPFRNLNTKESEREFEALSEHYQSIKYWKTFVNVGQLYLTTIQCTRLYGCYEHLTYRRGYSEAISENDNRIIKEYLHKSQLLLESGIDPAKYEYEILSYRILSGALMIISGGHNIKAGLDELEAVLISYQQANLNTETDSIFMCLMLGYFSLKDYPQCVKTFKRYSKSIKGKPAFEDNGIRIHAYYYMSQWLTTFSKQYIVKLNTLVNDSKANNSLKNFLQQMIEYFKVPAAD